MKKIYSSPRFSTMLKNKKFFFLVIFSAIFSISVKSQVSYTFTNCSATGSAGPTQPQVNAAYLPTNLNGSVTVASGIQSFTIPNSGPYEIDAYGANGGGNFAGLGARIKGEFTLTAGTVLYILVGQQGASGNLSHGSGGGGSFITFTNNALLIAAGGGGGKGASQTGTQTACNGTTGINGQTPMGGSPAGTGGGGGAAASGATGGTSVTPGANSPGSTWASGGGGYYTNGGNCNAGATIGGRSFLNGGFGGDPAPSGANSPGGFGGGGGAGDRGAGAGGYSGGAGAMSNSDGGGGGGSYNSGSNQLNQSGVNNGMGYVIVTSLCNNLPAAPTNTTDLANYTVCPGGTTTLAATGTGTNISWHSTINSIPVLGTGTTFITPTLTPGTYTYWAMETNTCSSGPRTPVTFTVIQSPTVTISGNISLCTGYSVNLTASGADTYSWNTGATTSTVTGLASTQFTVVGVSALTGCSASAVSELTLVPAPSLSIAGASSICATNVLSLTASGADTYFWNTGATTPGISATLTSNTTYTLVGTFTANGCTTRVQKTILVNPLPILSVTGANTICAGETATITASGAAGYFWSTGPSTASVGLSPNTSTTYSVVGVTDAGCTSTLIVNVYLQCVGIKSHANNSVPVSIYPNPTNGEFTIEMKNGLKKTVEVIDLTGRIVVVESSDKDKIDFNIRDLANGIYYVKVRTKMSVEVIKIVKQ